MLEWRDVLRAVSDPGTRSAIVKALGERGFKPVSLTTKTKPREALADALTEVEDWLEANRPRAPERRTLREVRRRLERELWP